jgi:tetratricopeptide (TPR) repeat protein/TolB-like protein
MECPKCGYHNHPTSHFCTNCGTGLPPPEGAARDTEKGGAVMWKGGEEPVIGSSFAGRYHILDKLGRGGMGMVFKAEDTKLRRPVALKFLPPQLTQDPEARARFMHEAQAASVLDHPNICTIYEIDESRQGHTYIAMAYCEGETLTQRIARGPLAVDEAVSIGAQVARGLAIAHEAGMTHRDIKPGNIMISPRGTVKIVDFGLAKLAGQTRITRAGTAMGTATYMSPEQARGEDVGLQTDLWSLGVVLYEMVTGEVPFRGEYDQAVIYSILNEDPKPVAELRKDIPTALERIIDRCLKKNPQERYQSAADLETDLSALQGQATQVETGARIVAGEASYLLSGRFRKFAVPAAIIVLALVLLMVMPPGRHIFKGLFGPGDALGEMRVAILPFNVVGGELEDLAFCDGLVEDLTRRLTQLQLFHEGFWVAPSVDVRTTGSNSPGEARRHLGVNVVVNGTMRCSGDDLDLILIRNIMGAEASQGVDTETLRQRRGPRISDPIANLSTWQDSVIRRLARLLEVDLSPQSWSLMSAGGTTVPSAFESYIRGLGYLYSYGRDKDIDAAIESFDQATHDDPSYALAFVGLGQAYLWKYAASQEARWTEPAIICCQRALQIDDQMATAHVTLGKIHVNSGNPEDATPHFERALQIDPANYEAHAGIGDIYEAVGKLEEAEAAYLKAIELRPRGVGIYHKLGYLYYRQGRYVDAIEPFRKLIDLMPGQTSGYVNLGGTYFQLGQLDDARRLFEQSMKIEPTCGVSSNLGAIYFWEQRFADAIEMFKKALDISPEHYEVWGNLAESYYWCPGERDKGRAGFEKAIGLAEAELAGNPGDAKIMSYLASYYAMLQRAPMAQSFLERAVGADSSDPMIMFRIAETYELLHYREQALVWIEKALDTGLPRIVVEYHPGFGDLRADTRFQRIMDKMQGLR